MTPRSTRLWGTLAAALFVAGIGCSPTGPVAPSKPPAGPPVSNDLVVSGVGPVAGKPSESTALRIWGSGFQSGATVTFGGVATPSTGTPDYIYATAPPHPAGTVDVVVTNPDGRTSRLEKAFTYVEDFLASGDITLEPGRTVKATLDFFKTCGFEDNACRLLIIQARPEDMVEVELVPLDRQNSIGLYERQPFWSPTEFPKRLTVRGDQQVWVIGDWALFSVTARLVK